MRLLSDRRGVTAVEFALVAPVFLMLIFLIIDGARMTWTYQTLQEVAANSARCAALKLTSCADSASVQSYAVARAAASGVRLGSADVTLTASTSCQSIGGMTKVAISTAYQGASTKLLPTAMTTLVTDSCFPTQG